MTREQFVNCLVGACAKNPPPILQEVARLAEQVYDPSLATDDAEQLRRAIIAAHQRAAHMAEFAALLESTIQKAIPSVQVERE